MMRQEFDDSFLIRKIVSDFVRAEIKNRPCMSDESFKQYHKLYLQSLKKPKEKATFQGKYVLICFDENDSHNTRQRYLLDSATGKEVLKMKLKHEDHNYLLLHQSRAKKYGIKRTNLIWRNLA